MSAAPRGRIVVVGAGHAGVALVAAMQHLGFDGTLTLVSAEPHLPYSRPPLSKAMLTDPEAQPTLLRSSAFYVGPRVELVRNDPAVRINRAAGRVELASGRTLEYDRLVLATGSRPRALPGQMPHGEQVLCLGNVDDSLRLRARLAASRRMTVLGGGYIGLEVAAAARKLGVEVTVVEREPRVLARVASPPFAQLVTDLHRAQGVEFILGASVDELRAETSVQKGVNGVSVHLADGRCWPSDLVLSAIGAEPCVELAAATGLPCQQGIEVDANQVSADPSILAIGDCARSDSPRYRRALRLESVQAATEQARIAAATLCGAPRPAPEVAWFWSEQHGVKLQIAGLLPAQGQIVVQGEPPFAPCSFEHVVDGRISAVESFDDPAGHVRARRLLESMPSMQPSPGPTTVDAAGPLSASGKEGPDRAASL